jgi:hypothetical protein
MHRFVPVKQSHLEFRDISLLYNALEKRMVSEMRLVPLERCALVFLLLLEEPRMQSIAGVVFFSTRVRRTGIEVAMTGTAVSTRDQIVDLVASSVCMLVDYV